jgi:hypothetical protein
MGGGMTRKLHMSTLTSSFHIHDLHTHRLFALMMQYSYKNSMHSAIPNPCMLHEYEED